MSPSVDPVQVLGALVSAAATKAFGPDFAGIDPQVRRSDRADYQADLALGLARRVTPKQAPRAVAEALVQALPPNDVIAKVEIAGPGFLNITLTEGWIEGALARVLASDRLAVPGADTPERVVIDYSGPNVAKEMHVGHLRSTVLGDAMARLLEWRGHTVIRQNHLGDWGTPFGMLIEHLLDQGEAQAGSELALGELSAFYKGARAKFEGDPAFAERARKRVVLLQAGDEATLKWWRLLVELSGRYFEAVYGKLGVTLKPSDICGESFYNPRLGPLCRELEGSGKAVRDDGALCLFPPGFTNKEKQPLPLIIEKRDGGFGYATTDMAAIRYRVQDLKATRVLYVVGAPQAQHLAMIYAAAKELGWLVAPARAEHVAFGSVLGTDKRMFKSRSGDTVRLVDLVDAAVERAEAVVAAKAPDLPPDTQADVARMVGVGAIKFADLSSDRVKDYVFDLDRMVSFEGQTAGYVQYAHARVRSILRKAQAELGAQGATPAASPRLSVGIEAPVMAGERTLALALLSFGAVVRSVEESLEPHRLAGYVLSLATAFTGFYEHCPILKADDATRASRLALAEACGRTMRQGLGLLGIDAPDRM